MYANQHGGRTRGTLWERRGGVVPSCPYHHRGCNSRDTAKQQPGQLHDSHPTTTTTTPPISTNNTTVARPPHTDTTSNTNTQTASPPSSETPGSSQTPRSSVAMTLAATATTRRHQRATEKVPPLCRSLTGFVGGLCQGVHACVQAYVERECPQIPSTLIPWTHRVT